MDACANHAELAINIKTIQNNQSQLYDLDREKAKELTEIKVTVARIDERQQSFSERIESIFIEFEKQMIANNETTNRLIGIKEESEIRIDQKKWTPKDFIQLVAALVGSGGIAALMILFIR